MKTTIQTAIIAAVLAGCAGSHPAPVDDTHPWLPVDCDQTERIVWESSGSFAEGSWTRRTTVTSHVAIVDADGADVTVRMGAASPWPTEPCAEIPVESCDILSEEVLSPDGIHTYRGAWDHTVTGLDTGEARILCALEIAISTTRTYDDGRPPETRESVLHEDLALGGEYRVR